MKSLSFIFSATFGIIISCTPSKTASMNEFETQIHAASKTGDPSQMERLAYKICNYYDGTPHSHLAEKLRLAGRLWLVLDSMTVLTPAERTTLPIANPRMDLQIDEPNQDAHSRMLAERRVAAQESYNERYMKQFFIDSASQTLHREMALLCVREYSTTADDTKRLQRDLKELPEQVRALLLSKIEELRSPSLEIRASTSKK